MWLGCAVVFTAWACAASTPLERLAECVESGSRAARADGVVASVRCDLKQPVRLVGIPAQGVDLQQLKEAGLASVSDLLTVKGVTNSARWCTIEEHAASPPTPKSGETTQQSASARCEETPLAIGRLVSLGNISQVDISISRQGETPVLVKIAGASSAK